MSDVSTKYSTSPVQNTSLGGLSLVENETRFRDINDLFRRIMADARQESNEVRILIADASSKASDARARADTASGNLLEVQAAVSQVQSDVSVIEGIAEQAAQAASEASSTVSGIASDASSAVALAQANGNLITALNERVVNLEQAATTDASLVQVDGETVVNTNAELKAIDVAVDEGLASERGQIGRTAVSAGAALDTLFADGWYAVGGDGASGLPEGVVSGVVRVSSGYASGVYMQTLIATGTATRVFVRATVDGGTVWEDWKEAVFGGSVGSGLHFEDGVLTADFSSVLPETSAEDTGRALSAEGQWMDVAKPSDIEAVYAAINSVEESVEAVQANLETIGATIAMGPDNETILITDGTMSVPVYLGATSEAAGRAGLVPAAEAGDEEKFLRGDGTYATPALNIANYDGENAGLVPAAEQGEQAMYLKGDGTWDNPVAALAETVATLAETVSGFNDRIAALEAAVAAMTPTEPEEQEEQEGEGGE